MRSAEGVEKVRNRERKKRGSEKKKKLRGLRNFFRTVVGARGGRG